MNLNDLAQVNPKLAWLLASVSVGGRVYVKSQAANQVLDMFPELSSFTPIRHLNDIASFSHNDYLILEEADLRDEAIKFGGKDHVIDGLLSLAQTIGCHVILFGERDFSKELVDFSISESEWRSILLSFQQKGGGFMQGFKDLLKKDSRKALFLDRDGVVVEDTAYLSTEDQVKLRPGVECLFQAAKAMNYLVILITNQSGVGRGFFTEQDYQKVHNKVIQLLAEKNCFIDATYTSYFIENSQSAQGLLGMSRRKPRVGNIHLAKKEWNIDLSQSVFIGDRATDMMCASLAGIKKLYMTQTDWFETEKEKFLHWGLIGHLPEAPKFELLSDYTLFSLT